MKILIVGEASGVSPTLKAAFEALGHSCEILAFSNPQKREGIRSFSASKGKVRMVLSHFYFMWCIYKASKKSDVIISIGSPWLSNFLNFFPNLGFFYIKNIKKNCPNIMYYALGCDPFFVNSESIVCRGCLKKADMVTQKCATLYRGKYAEAVRTINTLYTAYFVAMPDYICTDIKKDLEVYLPLPFHVKENVGRNLSKRTKIKIIHAPSGRNRKGSKYILAAMERVQNDFPDTVECIVLENLPYADFQRAFSEADIVVDQCLSQSYGMLAIEGLSMGKVVLSGGVFFDSYASNIPIVNIIPDSSQIYEAITKAITMVADEDYSQQAVAYVTKVHCYTDLARKILTHI